MDNPLYMGLFFWSRSSHLERYGCILMLSILLGIRYYTILVSTPRYYTIEKVSNSIHQEWDLRSKICSEKRTEEAVGTGFGWAGSENEPKLVPVDLRLDLHSMEPICPSRNRSKPLLVLSFRLSKHDFH